jgi:hypothetical protein
MISAHLFWNLSVEHILEDILGGYPGRIWRISSGLISRTYPELKDKFW